MNNDLRAAFEHMDKRRKPVGADHVAALAWDAAMPARHVRGRRIGKRSAFVVAAALVVVVGVAGVVARSKVNAIRRVDVASALAPDGGVTGRVETILVVGTETSQQEAPTPEGAVGRPDAISLVRIAVDGRVSVLAIPRDLYVASVDDRMSTMLTHGRSALINAVSAATGVTIDHYIEMNSHAFPRVVDALGGVSVRFPTPTRDRFSGLDVSAKGCVNLNGEQALRYVVSRHIESFENGRWENDPTGDIGRIGRQQQLLVSALSQIRDRIGGNVLTLNRVLDVVSKAVTTDEGLSTNDLIEIGRRASGHGDVPITTLVLPTTVGVRSDATFLYPDETTAPDVITIFTDPPVRPATDATSAPECTNP